METTVLNRLIEITIYSAVIFLAVVLFRQAFFKQLAPGLKYALWLIVLLRLVVPVTLESTFHLITLPEEERVPAIAMAQSTPMQVLTANTPAPGPAGTGAPAAAPMVPAAPTTPAPEPAAPRLSWRQWLLIVWLAGCLLVLLYQAGMALRLNRRIRARGVQPDAATMRLYDRVRQSMRVKANLPVLLVDDIASPALTVQLRPRLLLPDGLVDRKTKKEQVFSIAHELMHYKRRDHLALLLLSLLRAVYWFNPVVWLLPRVLRTDMESACDAQVVRHMNKQDKLQYANLLLEFSHKSGQALDPPG